MYKEKTKKQLSLSKNKILLSILLVVAVLVFVLVYKSIQTSKDQDSVGVSTTSNNINYEPATKEDKQQVEQSKVTDPKVENQTSQPNNTDDGTAEIISTELDSDKNLIIKTKLSGGQWKICTISVTSGSVVVTKRVNALYQSDFSTCLGYTIPSKEIPNGSVTIQLSAEKSNGTIVKSADKTIDKR